MKNEKTETIFVGDMQPSEKGFKSKLIAIKNLPKSGIQIWALTCRSHFKVFYRSQCLLIIHVEFSC